jgi:hypothetical protein
MHNESDMLFKPRLGFLGKTEDSVSYLPSDKFIEGIAIQRFLLILRGELTPKISLWQFSGRCNEVRQFS